MPTELLTSFVPWMFAFFLAMLFFVAWLRERISDRRFRELQFERDEQRARQEADRKKEEAEAAREEVMYQDHLKTKQEEESAVRDTAGAGSGGYIVVDLPEERRSLFHDLLKGFEEYARLKGYSVSFSVDATFSNRIAFKFTLTDPDVVVGINRVRSDLKEYLDRIRGGEPLDDLPVVTTVAEHDILMTTLKNRISFLQHSYNLAQNAVDFYESLIRKASSMSVLPAQSVVVQTGGALNSPTYSAVNSPRALLGDGTTADNNLRIVVSFAERQNQIEDLDRVLALLRDEAAGEARDKTIHNLMSVREELEGAPEPESGRVAEWLERTRQALQLGGLGHETIQAAKELLSLFGLK